MQDWEVVETTADIIEKRGWCTGVLIDGEGRVCVDGALAYALNIPEVKILETCSLRQDDWDLYSNAVYVTPDIIRLAGRICDALELEKDYVVANTDPTVTLYQWNDNPDYHESAEDNKQRVLDGMRKAAKIIRQQDEV